MGRPRTAMPVPAPTARSVTRNFPPAAITKWPASAAGPSAKRPVSMGTGRSQGSPATGSIVQEIVRCDPGGGTRMGKEECRPDLFHLVQGCTVLDPGKPFPAGKAVFRVERSLSDRGRAFPHPKKLSPDWERAFPLSKSSLPTGKKAFPAGKRPSPLGLPAQTGLLPRGTADFRLVRRRRSTNRSRIRAVEVKRAGCPLPGRGKVGLPAPDRGLQPTRRPAPGRRGGPAAPVPRRATSDGGSAESGTSRPCPSRRSGCRGSGRPH